MAAIVRVKRRFDEDPANSLLVSCKRPRTDGQQDEELPTDSSDIRSLFKFAGTVPTKQADVTAEVRNAIRRVKLQKEYKRHEVDITSLSRQSQAATAGKNRFKVVSSKRAIDLDSLDKEVNHSCENGRPDNTPNEETDKSQSPAVSGATSQLSPDASQSETVSCASQSETVSDGSHSPTRVYCLYDIEEEPSDSPPEIPMVEEPETVTCNGVVMERRKVSPKPPSAEYVYDIYYMNSAEFDFHSLENILAIEALKEDFLIERGEGDGAEDRGEDEDSNDEDNWRNDYPEEGGVIGAQTINFNDGDDSPDDQEDSDDDYEADYGMSAMMGNRLKICDSEESLSSEGEDFTYFHQPMGAVTSWSTGQSYESYKSHVLRELKEDYGEDKTT